MARFRRWSGREKREGTYFLSWLAYCCRVPRLPSIRQRPERTITLATRDEISVASVRPSPGVHCNAFRRYLRDSRA